MQGIPDPILVTGAVLLAWMVYVLVTWLPSLNNPGAGALALYKGLSTPAPYVCDENSRVCDNYIAASARSCFSGSWAGTAALAAVLTSGARWITLDIHELAGQPVICDMNENWQFRTSMNSVPLADVLHTIMDIAWDVGKVTNATDPLFIHFDTHTEDVNVLAQVAQSVKNVLRPKLLGLDYSHQNKDIAQEKICTLKGKAVIVSNGVKGSLMDEVTNWVAGGPSLRRLTVLDAEETYDATELTNFNRQRVTLCTLGPDKKNRSPKVAWHYGCQVVLLDWSSIGDEMNAVMEQFGRQAIVTKPEELLFSQPTFKRATPQDPTKYYTPIQVVSKLYTATI